MQAPQAPQAPHRAGAAFELTASSAAACMHPRWPPHSPAQQGRHGRRSTPLNAPLHPPTHRFFSRCMQVPGEARR